MQCADADQSLISASTHKKVADLLAWRQLAGFIDLHWPLTGLRLPRRCSFKLSRTTDFPKARLGGWVWFTGWDLNAGRV